MEKSQAQMAKLIMMGESRRILIERTAGFQKTLKAEAQVALKLGASQAEVAQALGLTRGAVHFWVKKEKNGEPNEEPNIAG